MKISTSHIPKISILKSKFKTIDFQDAYTFYTPNNSLSINELYIALFSTAPKWIDYLMALRNNIVGVFGLKTGTKRNTNPNFKIGDTIGIFKIYDLLENEIIAGEDDKHLDFRVSICREVNDTTKVTVSTLVKYNNWFGKLYFTIVAPFHKLVVKGLLKKSAKAIAKL